MMAYILTCITVMTHTNILVVGYFCNADFAVKNFALRFKPAPFRPASYSLQLHGWALFDLARSRVDFAVNCEYY